MKATDLNILLQEGEGVMLEYKEGLSSSFARELVAFANTAGGRILLGVRDDGTVKGIADTNQLRARIQDIARNCDPPVKILLQRIGEVTVVTVRESDAKPVQCSDGYFWRQGAVTQKLSRDEIRDLFRSEGAIRFDTSLCPKFRYPQDFDREKYNAWLRLSGITGRPRTEDVPEYPMKALREAITNAVMHRDWFMEGANVFVEIYTDRIEISSPGGLPKGMKLADLGRKSIRRNALIADLLHRITFIEKAGTGIRRMREEAHDQHCPAPIFEESGFFTAIFYPNPEVRAQVGTKEAPSTAQVGTKLGPSRDQVQAHDTEESTPQVPLKHPSSTPQVTGQVTGQVAGQVTGQVSAEILKMLEIISGEMTRMEIQAALGLKGRANFEERYLKPAMELGLVDMTRPDKLRSSRQRYRTTAAGRAVLESAEKETRS